MRSIAEQKLLLRQPAKCRGPSPIRTLANFKKRKRIYYRAGRDRLGWSEKNKTRVVATRPAFFRVFGSVIVVVLPPSGGCPRKIFKHTMSYKKIISLRPATAGRRDMIERSLKMLVDIRNCVG